MPSLLSLAEHVGLVTGAASGLGKEVVHRLASRVKNIVAVDIQNIPDDVKALKNVHPISGVDVASEEDIKVKVMDVIEKTFGRLDFVVNSAGITMLAPIYSFDKDLPHPLDAFKKIFDVNVVGTFNVVRLAVGLMARKEPINEDGLRGCIINVASIAGLDGPPFMIAYCSSKAAVHGMTLSLARDLAVKGIRCNAIAPGLFATPMTGGGQGALIEEHLKTVPCPSRAGKVEEFAHLVETILQNPMINGETIRLDAGCRSTGIGVTFR